MSKIPSVGGNGDAPIRWLAMVLIGLAVAAVAGRLAVHTVNDTPSYVDYPFDSLREALLSIRTPGYPILLAIVRSTLGLAMVPAVQVTLHATASWMLCEELRHRGMPTITAFVAGLCVLLGCTWTDHVHTISTDAPAASLGVITAVLLMRTVRTIGVASAIACGTAAVITIFVRPAYLSLIPWIAVAAWLLARREASGDPSRWRRAVGSGLAVAICVTVPLVGWMGLRKAVVNDFALLPFGHQGLSAVLVQLVPPAVLRDLPTDGTAAELGRRVADALQREDFILPQSTSDRIATLTLEQQSEQVIYDVIWPTAREIDRQTAAANDDVDSRVRVHRMIAAMNLAILKAAPRNYLRWLALAVRRAVWGTAANIAMHPLFLTAILLAIVWLLKRASDPQPFVCPPIPDGWPALVVVAISYLIFNVGFVLLSSPPIGRYADAGAIFLPAVIVTRFLHTDSADASD
jgi:tRNA threonylcarbamoyladenosine modification (KEOPS) complex  Pcc1 subunit